MSQLVVTICVRHYAPWLLRSGNQKYPTTCEIPTWVDHRSTFTYLLSLGKNSVICIYRILAMSMLKNIITLSNDSLNGFLSLKIL